MKLKDFQKDLELIVNQHSLDTEFNLPDFAIADYIMDCLNALMRANSLKPQSDGVDDFIDRMYASYPARCPKRNASLGKTRKDKERIRKLLKTYSMEEIEKVFKHEIEEKYEKQYMQNFSTFLNNFPDVTCINEQQKKLFELEDFSHTHKKIILDGQEYR